ncbi:energy-coupling factor transporter transmembrane component T family protein [Priestia taiwanensis]|uniref:Energy-coupling factor transporter transmembrane protein EcfT n=1 Tax=Priestia taiwanensis TaxID=1347902 RepID=A0A917AXR3_9BACI|nr:energy-coupling factor transporter transmembrane protein EcfT [Priestia taiwanensis]MBM7365087.1 energy-coupling factor transport system permease protein [Priestia taiwanensis]GGE84348.1 energy-coupling factor transporter transmembrane protein EcfT [Priestia taiwanensis]
MLSNMIIGRYVPGRSFIHQLDPRSKLTATFIFMIIVFLANNVYTYGLLIGYTALAIYVSNVRLRFLVAGLKPILWLFLFTFFLHILTNKQGEVLIQAGWFSVHAEGLRQGIFISIRFLLLITMTTLLTLTTTPIAITDGMESILSPVKRILPVHEIALMMSISLRFIPTLMQEMEKVMKAQTARGIDFASGPMKERLRAMVSLLIPLFVSSFKRAEDLAMAMESRGYRGGEHRTKYRELIWRRNDTLIIGSLLVVTIVLYLIRS